jgi:hypothetical protein
VGTQSWTADRDYVFIGAWQSSTVVGSTVSQDPAITPSLFQTATKLYPNVMFNASGSAKSSTSLRMNIPVQMGTTLYIATGAGANTVLVYLEEDDDGI